MIWNKSAARERMTAPDCRHPGAGSPCGSHCAASRNSAAAAGGSIAVVGGGGVLAVPPSTLPGWLKVGRGGDGGGMLSDVGRLQPVFEAVASQSIHATERRASVFTAWCSECSRPFQRGARV